MPLKNQEQPWFKKYWLCTVMQTFGFNDKNMDSYFSFIPIHIFVFEYTTCWQFFQPRIMLQLRKAAVWSLEKMQLLEGAADRCYMSLLEWSKGPFLLQMQNSKQHYYAVPLYYVC